MLSELGSTIMTIFSGIVPILGTLIVGLVLYAKQDYDRVQNMRRAFLAELNAVVLPTYIENNDGAKIPSPYDSKLMPTYVYDNNVDNIGKLSAEEVNSLVDFYSLAHNPSHLIEVMVEMELFVDDPQWDNTKLEEKKETAIKNVEEGLNMGFWGFLWQKIR